MSSRSIVKNSTYNILGYGIPLVFAVFLIPALLNNLGTERFGLLNLIWIIIGYSSFFDFGIGRSLTKVIAEKIGTAQSNQIPGIFWNALYLMLGISLIVSIILVFSTPYLINNSFNISNTLKSEATSAMYGLIFSIPIVITTAGVRGTLEAYQKFGIINIVRIFLGIFTFLGPLIVLFFINSLFWIVVFLLFIRLITWLIYLRYIFKINCEIKSKFKFEFNLNLIRPLLKLSIWITVANIIGPLMLYSDRFLISSIVSAAALTFYATPYEIVTKLLLIPNALTTVLFPMFSSSHSISSATSQKLFQSGVKFTFLILFPLVFLTITFSFEGMSLWLGKDFATNSFVVLQFLAIGVFFNALAYIPFNYFQGIGKPKIPAIINLIEFPIYLFAMWSTIKHFGINGAALVWTIRILIDTIILFSISYYRFNVTLNNNFIFFIPICLVATLILTLIVSSIILKIIATIFFLTFFAIYAWKYVVNSEEKNYLLSRIKPNFT